MFDMHNKIFYANILNRNMIAFVDATYWMNNNQMQDYKDKNIYDKISDFHPSEICENVYEFEDKESVISFLENNEMFSEDIAFKNLIARFYR